MTSDYRFTSPLRQFVMPLRAGMIAGLVFLALVAASQKP